MHGISSFCFGSCWGWKLCCGQQEIPLHCHLWGTKIWPRISKSSLLCVNKFSTGAQNHGKIFCHLDLSSLAEISSSCYPSCLVLCHLPLPLQIFFIMMAKAFRVKSCLRSPGLTANALHTCFSSDSVNLRLQHSHTESEKENSNRWWIVSFIFRNNCIIILCPLKAGCFFSMMAHLGFNISFLALIIEQFS